MSVILMTTLFNKALLLQREIWRWSLLGLKGLSVISCLVLDQVWLFYFGDQQEIGLP